MRKLEALIGFLAIVLVCFFCLHCNDFVVNPRDKNLLSSQFLKNNDSFYVFLTKYSRLISRLERL